MIDWREIKLDPGSKPAHGATVLAYGRNDKGIWYVTGTYRAAHPAGVTELDDRKLFHPLAKFTHYVVLYPPRETMSA